MRLFILTTFLTVLDGCRTHDSVVRQKTIGPFKNVQEGRIIDEDRLSSVPYVVKSNADRRGLRTRRPDLVTSKYLPIQDYLKQERVSSF